MAVWGTMIPKSERRRIDVLTSGGLLLVHGPASGGFSRVRVVVPGVGDRLRNDPRGGALDLPLWRAGAARCGLCGVHAEVLLDA